MSIPFYVLLSLIAYSIYRISRIGRRHPRMPKGPPTIPFFGNALQIPTTGLGKKFHAWAQEYGSVFSLTVGTTNIVVLCDRKSVHSLMDKKGSIYSDRPPQYVANYITHGDHLTLESQGPSWREKRSVVTRNLNPKLLDEKHWRIQEAEAVIFMNNLLKRPDEIFELAKLYTASVATTLLYGQRAVDVDSFWYKDLYALMEQWLTAQEPGANPPIDEFPFLRLFPGHWKRRAVKTRKTMDDMWTKARSIVDERRARGDKRDCFIDNKLDDYEKNGWPMSQHAFNNLFGELLEAGADTTANHILTLILAFAKYPDVQRKAREEIDRVCGTERAPLFSDFEDLPYINACVKEGMRWRPTAPAGLPHMGMFIPKGTMVFVGIWAIHQNEEIFSNHDQFNPDRYLGHPKLANEYATDTGFHIIMAMEQAGLLWAFDISEPTDIMGNTLPLDPNGYTSAILVSPLPFKVKVIPRSKEHLVSIERELVGALEFLSQWE
ncbi:related to O-methylsterigmatocystin oxidoreductase [Phialocephala subalpina]|uniref:Related to O-methylsterigmatocystin oxidoreductase n=1 Tax=Phialocephala subalpina TaxID=576137 RepID=A0A1L7XHC4_9HELO|nr:related to O-methylsterigmatocystin oxidoreductase [Phialocephala subalpina]